MGGIFNPFEAPKPKLPTYDEAQEALEREAAEKNAQLCSASLDGGTYVLRLDKVLPDEASIFERLGALLKDIVKDPALRNELEGRYGVFFLPEKTGQVNLTWLKTPHGYLGVTIEDNKSNDTKAYNRLGRALYGLPIKQTLAAHNAVLMKRG